MAKHETACQLQATPLVAIVDQIFRRLNPQSRTRSTTGKTRPRQLKDNVAYGTLETLAS